MRRLSFYKTNRSGNLLHIETEGCIVNIRVGLSDVEGREVTSVEILANEAGETWLLDGHINNRVIKQVEGTMYVMGGEYDGRDGQFRLVRPTNGLPYVTVDPKGSLVNLSKHHSHLYRLSVDWHTAHLVKDYLIDGVGHPESAELSDEDYKGVCKQIMDGDINE